MPIKPATILLPVLAGVIGLGSVAQATEIQWMRWAFGSTEEKQQVEQDLKDFTAKTGITVKVIEVPGAYNSQGEKLIPLLAAGEPPDVVELRGQREFPEYATLGLMTDLSPFLKTTSLPLDDWAPGMLDALKWDGATLGIPTGADFYMTQYNPDKFAQAGLVTPGTEWSWDDLRTAAKAMTQYRSDGTVEQYGLQLASYGWGTMIQSAGVPALKADHTWNWTGDRQDVVAMLTFFRDLFLNDKVVDPKGNFFGGRNGVSLGLACCIPKASKIGISWDVAAYPTWRDHNPGVQMIVSGLGIPKASKHPQAAFKFIEWYMSRDRMLPRIRGGEANTTLLPDRVEMLANLQVLGQVAPHYADVAKWTFNNGFMHPFESWYIGDQNWWSIPYIGQALLGEMGVANALNQTATLYNKLLASGAGWRKK